MIKRKIPREIGKIHQNPENVISATVRGIHGCIAGIGNQGMDVCDADQVVIGLLTVSQRPEGRGKETDQSTKDDSDLLAYRMELKVMDIEGAPEGSRLLYYPVRVRSYATKALLDSGASVNCIDEDVVNKVGGYLQKKPEGVLLYPDRRKAKVRGVTQLEIRGKGYRENVSFWVVSGLGVPVLLGAP